MSIIYFDTALETLHLPRDSFAMTNFGLLRKQRDAYYDAVLKPGSKADKQQEKEVRRERKENNRLVAKQQELTRKLRELSAQRKKNAASPSIFGAGKEWRLMRKCQSILKSEEKLMNKCWDNAARRLDGAMFHDRAAQLYTFQAIENKHGLSLRAEPKHAQAQDWLRENGADMTGVEMRMGVLYRRAAKLPDFDTLPGFEKPELFGSEYYKPELVLSPEELAEYDRLTEPKDAPKETLASGHVDPMELGALREDTVLFDEDGASTLASAALSGRRSFDFAKNGISFKNDGRARVAKPAADREKGKEAQQGAAQRKKDDAPFKQ